MQVRGTGEAGMSEQRPGFEEPSSRPRGRWCGREVRICVEEGADPALRLREEIGGPGHLPCRECAGNPAPPTRASRVLRRSFPPRWGSAVGGHRLFQVRTKSPGAGSGPHRPASCTRPLVFPSVGRSLDAGGAKANIFLSAPVGAPAGTSGTSHSQVADLRGARPKGHAAALPHQCNQCGRRNSLPASFWEELARSHFSSPSLRSLQTCLKLTPHFSCFSMSLDASTTP